MTTFLRVLSADDKAAALLAAIHDPENAQGKQRFEVDPASFTSVPRSPFAYWVSERVRRLFVRGHLFESDGRTAKCGMGTLDDFRFLRLHWENGVLSRRERWRPFAKGGAFSAYYADVFLVVRWCSDGAEVKTFVEAKVGSASRKVQATDFYFRPGLTWPRRTNGLSFRALPTGCIFADKGPAAFVDDDRHDELLALAAIANSAAFGLLVAVQLARTHLAQSFEVGLIQTTPVPRLAPVDRATLAGLARRAWSVKRSLDTRAETSHAFSLPGLLQVVGGSLADRAAAWVERVAAAEVDLGSIQGQIDERCFDLYGIEEADRQAIEGSGQGSVFSDQAETTDHGLVNTQHPAAEHDTDEASDDPMATTDLSSLTAELLSWCVGVAFGRFDVRLATGARALLNEPEPFDPLPICSPGMLQNADGLPPRPDDVPATYPFRIPWYGVLVDDVNHPLDIERRVRELIRIIWKDRAETIETEACEILGVKSLREYFRKPTGFFAGHLKRYSKSRRQASIYWPLSTASGTYTLWIYYHRLTDQTLYACVNDFVQPKLNDLERDISRLRDEKRTRDLQAAAALQAELEDLKQELLAWAPRWKPDLNDGVMITACPIWRLFRLPKWRRDLEACWKKLEAGDYDWAHLAYSLWPERVREKCKKDRSLAIAHGLEEICEVPPPQAKRAKKPRGGRGRAGRQIELLDDETGEETEA
jgi:hypothetical protein